VAGDVPAAVVDRWKNLGELGYGQGKEAQKRLTIAAWRLGGWEHPQFQEVIAVDDRKQLTMLEKLLPWSRCLVKFGGEAAALQALRDEDLIAVNDPQAPEKIKYKLAEISLSRSRDIQHKRNLGVKHDTDGSLYMETFTGSVEQPRFQYVFCNLRQSSASTEASGQQLRFRCGAC
jgi:hypothetical protein